MSRLRGSGPLEADIQRAILDYLRLALPGYLTFHIPNGGRRGRVEAARLKGQGVLAGVADLCILGPGGFCGWIEVKRPGEKLTPAQERFRDDCQVFRIGWCCCRRVEDAWTAVRLFGLRPREVAL